MTDTEIKANLYALERRIYELEQVIKRTAAVGDLVEVEWQLYGDVYERRKVVIKSIAKAHEDGETFSTDIKKYKIVIYQN